METNNQNLPPVPVPPLPPQKNDNINYIEPGTAKRQNKKTIIFAVVFVIIVVAVYGVFIAKAFRKDAKNINASGNSVSITLGKSNISAQLASKEMASFVINAGKASSMNTGEFAVWPMEKVKYLEQKYTDFIHCGSPGEAEGKSNLINISLIANSSAAERGLRKIEKLVEKGNLVVVEIDGSKLEQIQGLNPERTTSGMFVYEKVQPNAFYLIDDMRIVQEKYQ